MTLKESFLEFLHHGKIYSKKQIIRMSSFPFATHIYALVANAPGAWFIAKSE